MGNANLMVIIVTHRLELHQWLCKCLTPGAKKGTIFCLPTWVNYMISMSISGLPRWLSGKESVCQCRWPRRHRFNPWAGKIPWRRKWQPSIVFLLGKSHGQRSLVGCSPWGCKESDMTEHTHMCSWIWWPLTLRECAMRGSWKGRQESKYAASCNPCQAIGVFLKCKEESLKTLNLVWSTVGSAIFLGNSVVRM